MRDAGQRARAGRPRSSLELLGRGAIFDREADPRRCRIEHGPRPVRSSAARRARARSCVRPTRRCAISRRRSRKTATTTACPTPRAPAPIKQAPPKAARRRMATAFPTPRTVPKQQQQRVPNAVATACRRARSCSCRHEAGRQARSEEAGLPAASSNKDGAPDAEDLCPDARPGRRARMQRAEGLPADEDEDSMPEREDPVARARRRARIPIRRAPAARSRTPTSDKHARRRRGRLPTWRGRRERMRRRTAVRS